MAETGVWSKYFITQAGRNLRQSCIAEGKRLVFTQAAIGTGIPSDPAGINTMTGLVSYATDVIIKKSYAIEENHLCVVRVDNSGYTQAVPMTEVGVFARSEDQADSQAVLYGYAYNLGGYVNIPAQTSLTNRKIYELTLDTYLGIATDIEIVYDGSTLFVSHADLDDWILAHQSDPGLHADLWAELGDKANVPEVEWYYPELLNNATSELFRYRKEGNVVYLEGWIGNVSVGTLFCLLPEGFRPSTEISIAASQSSSTSPHNTARLVIWTSGYISVARSDLVGTPIPGSVATFCSFTIA